MSFHSIFPHYNYYYYRSQNFWILYANCLYFFRSKDDFEEWLLNPYLSKSDRGNLVKRYLKFDSANAKYFDMDKTRMKYYRKGGMMYVYLYICCVCVCLCGSMIVLLHYCIVTTSSYCSFLNIQNMCNIHKHRYHFKLVLHYVRGNSTSLHLVGAFSSMNENDVIELHTIIHLMMRNNPRYAALHYGVNSDTQST